MPIIEIVDLDKTKPEAKLLQQHARRIYSQHGEEGAIEYCFKILGERNKWCVEFGAWDGEHLSNTCYFARDHGWHCVQIEGDDRKFDQLQKNFADVENTVEIKAIVGYERGVNTIDDILATTDAPTDLDFISIDIDGNDYYIWESMEKFRPRLVVIEFNQTIPNNILFVQDRAMDIHQGCSLRALISLGKKKGYELVGTLGVNAFFVVAGDFPKFGIEDNSINAMKADAGGRIFAGYDGTIFNTLKALVWTGRGREIAIDEFQILPPESRLLGNRPRFKKK